MIFGLVMKRCNFQVGVYFFCASLLLSENIHISQAFLHTPHLIKGRESANDSPSSSSACKEPNGQFSDPKYCDKYVDCWEGKPVASGSCSHGLMFNEINSQCDYPKNVQCGSKEVSHQPHLDEGCEEAYGTFANSQNCAEYTVCHAGIAKHFKCGEGLAFDKEQLMCAPPHNPLCLETNLPNDRPEGEGLEELPLDPDNIKPAPSPPGAAGGGGQFPVPDWPKSAKCPTKASGFFPIVKDCQAVVVCLNGKGFLLNCPKGNYYDPRQAICRAGLDKSCEQMKFTPSSYNSGIYRYALFSNEYPILPSSFY